MKKRKRLVVAAVIVVVVAALVAGGILWSGRDTTATVHYLTSEVTTGTISQTVQADFTLSSANGTTSVALGGGAASSSSSAASSGSTAAVPATSGAASSAALASAAAAGATTFASLSTSGSADVVFAASDDLGSPSPSPSPSTTPTATPSPTVTPTPFPTPSPSQSGSTPSGGSGGSFSGSGGTSSASATTTSGSWSGVVTRLILAAGAEPQTLQRLLVVSGKTVFAFVSPTPLWKDLSTDLSSGSERANVAVLQRALKAQGYFKQAANGAFTSATETALKKWQKANGLSQTGVLSVTRFVWMPAGSVLTGWTVNLGSHVSSGSALATVVSPSRLTAEASISQADIADLKVGQKAQMTIDGYDDTFTGRIGYISSEPASSAAATGSSTSTQYAITIAPIDLPALAKSGMTGTLDIVIKQVTDVLVVPTSAVTGSSTSAYVRVMQNGTPVFRQVQTGMATASYTEITGGLAEGETVITGQYTEGAESAGSSQTTRSGGSLLQGGGAFPAGPPAGGGFPGGGGQ